MSFAPRDAPWLTPQVALNMDVVLPPEIRCVVSVRSGQSSSMIPSVGGRGIRDPVGLGLGSVAVSDASARPRLVRDDKYTTETAVIMRLGLDLLVCVGYRYRAPYPTTHRGGDDDQNKQYQQEKCWPS